MATIDLTRLHSLPKEEARKRTEEIAQSMEKKLGIQWKWDGDIIRFQADSGAAKGTKGELQVHEKEIRVMVDLPLMLRMMRKTIEEKIHEKLDRLA